MTKTGIFPGMKLDRPPDENQSGTCLSHAKGTAPPSRMAFQAPAQRTILSAVWMPVDVSTSTPSRPLLRRVTCSENLKSHPSSLARPTKARTHSSANSMPAPSSYTADIPSPRVNASNLASASAAERTS